MPHRSPEKYFLSNTRWSKAMIIWIILVNISGSASSETLGWFRWLLITALDKINQVFSTMLVVGKILKSCQCVFGISHGPSFEQIWIHFTKKIFYAKFGWIWASGSGEDKLWKVYDNDDDGQQTNFQKKYSLKFWAQVI